MKDFYKILNIQPSATEEEIKTAFRKLAHQHHPDKGGSEDKFKEINEAHQILSDKYQRGAYDATIFIMRQSAAYSSSPITQESVIRDSGVVRNAIILFLIGIGLWIWGDGSDSYNGFLVFLGWAFVIGAIVVYRHGKPQKQPKEEMESQMIFRRKEQDQNLKEIPLENLGFSGFVLEYCWNMSISERNKTILSVFPKKFWDDLGVSLNDVLAHADILCRGGAPLQIEIRKNEDEWLTKYGTEIFRTMKKATAHGGEFNQDKDFRAKCAEIAQAEKQTLGLYMLTLLPLEEQKKFLEKVHQSLAPDYALQMWAEVVCYPLAKMTGLVKKKGTETTTFLFEIVDEMGFVQTIDWIRSLSTDYNNFEDYVRKSSPMLLGMKKS